MAVLPQGQGVTVERQGAVFTHCVPFLIIHPAGETLENQAEIDAGWTTGYYVFIIIPYHTLP